MMPSMRTQHNVSPAARAGFAAASPSGRLPECIATLSAASTRPQTSPLSPELPADWLAPAAAFLASLQAHLAASPEQIDAAGLSATLERIPSLAGHMDIEGLARVFEAAMGQAAVSAAVTADRRLRGRRRAVTALAAAAVAPGVEFAPMAEAVARLGRKTPVVARLSSAEWEKVAVALRERGQFSAHVESHRFLATVQEKCARALALRTEEAGPGKRAFVDRDSFIRDLRRVAIEEGIETTGPAGAGTVRDIRSLKRLGLIYDMQTQSAAGFSRWKMDHDADVLDEFPAYRLGPSTAAAPRSEAEWRDRWMVAGGSVQWRGATRVAMAALKTSPVWLALSRFGTPWPPFDFGSTRELLDLDRGEAQSLGLLDAGGSVPQWRDGSGSMAFNRRLEASVADLGAEATGMLEERFGDQVEIVDGVARWTGDSGEDGA